MSNYSLSNRFLTNREVLAARARAFEREGSLLNMVDPVIDQTWAQMQVDSRGLKPYFDYYYAGEDIRVYIAELGDDPEFGNLPIQSFAFNIEQEKMPVYGYASYTWDTMLRGTRIIQGAFQIVTKHPGYMKDVLTKAASNRVKNLYSLVDDYPSPEGWREDDANIERYWGKNLDASALKQAGSEWSIHPPFSFVIVYGIQDTSLDLNTLHGRYEKYENDNNLLYDHNQRLVEAENTTQSTRIILDGCELKGLQRNYVPGSLVVETYQFLARDIIVPSPGYVSDNNKTRKVNVPKNVQ